VTRHGKEAVVIVSEQEWQSRTASRSASSLGELLARHAHALRDDITGRPWTERALGTDLD
jgi:PHD/YefM family antitoxin component YafN of YafNO toxin-antitoxin module